MNIKLNLQVYNMVAQNQVMNYLLVVVLNWDTCTFFSLHLHCSGCNFFLWMSNNKPRSPPLSFLWSSVFPQVNWALNIHTAEIHSIFLHMFNALLNKSFYFILFFLICQGICWGCWSSLIVECYGQLYFRRISSRSQWRLNLGAKPKACQSIRQLFR